MQLNALYQQVEVATCVPNCLSPHNSLVSVALFLMPKAWTAVSRYSVLWSPDLPRTYKHAIAQLALGLDSIASKEVPSLNQAYLYFFSLSLVANAIGTAHTQSGAFNHTMNQQWR
ncbi:hypothetical protein RP300_00496 [Oligella urethralis]|nr:hypothetical protein RP300_00496 [Oligella urethralis]